ncbi:hypothetical protein F441_10691 [Phytophthora nicotianae CJ01A1]|uniref:Uncharacterized protein n=6 Tax=Phytophthora nicotianae TaxID=4792 RepID=W2Q434_PHYN3|nr:hypothetical protein PPTG_12437 [Phytophthora nicotianae INRA-310]ETI44543.1 hypothetical protein F443_10758 [Phytophthora nicotianae P1569]ETK84538.1 hypothetical protein L915_10504 [Phytophthora nicotianae]ETO73188.1 hypothetical protein F444_10848 [Phytophthora nicotianae P1976]ETP14367.1 hypothetical protein F441_10691 [Phytophthora nicotianae CJ01A1]ETP42438.1 hypothetical protein F442_10661 [Phytophthora nicotianae P10297]KUF77855.1 hypothetical protein AM587_10010596 [Phytophthora n
MQPHTLKRTISKCSMDGDSPDSAACKKFSSGLDNEPVLLPREQRAPSFPPLDEDEPEVSPIWGDAAAYVLPSKIGSDFEAVNVAAVAPIQAPADSNNRDEISAAGMLAAVLDYLRDVASYCNRAVNLSFAQLRQMLQSIPFAVGQMQSVVKARLELSWPLVAAFVQNVTGFISDEDIRDASVGELAAFLQTCQTDYPIVAAPGNICANLFEFFHEVLTQFKQFLTKRWLQIGKISFPCEFGKKSDSLFLCMECHREHM